MLEALNSQSQDSHTETGKPHLDQKGSGGLTRSDDLVSLKNVRWAIEENDVGLVGGTQSDVIIRESFNRD